MSQSKKIEKIKESIKAQLSIDPNELDIEEVQQLLNQMSDVVEQIKISANNYPDNPISAEVWMDGAAMIHNAQVLTDYLHRAEFIELEAIAAQIWANVTLAVCGHYRHMVGPAMIANAKIAERMGNMDFAMQAYTAVLKDFLTVLEECEEHGYIPEDEEAIAMDSLKEAAGSLVRLYDGSEACAKAIEVQKRIEKVLG